MRAFARGKSTIAGLPVRPYSSSIKKLISSGWKLVRPQILGTTPGVRPQLVPGAAWLLSAAAGLIGAIATEARVRETGDFAEAHHATRLWLGVLAFLPAWVIVLSGHVVR
jgi:hypothetical protein